MAEQQRQSLCPRLIDYLAIVGARTTNTTRSGAGQQQHQQNPVQVSLTYLHFYFKLDAY